MTVESRVKTRVQGVRGLGCFKCDTLSIKTNCNASTIPSRAYINHIQRNFFPRTSLEGQTTWSKMVKIDQNLFFRDFSNSSIWRSHFRGKPPRSHGLFSFANKQGLSVR